NPIHDRSAGWQGGRRASTMPFVEDDEERAMRVDGVWQRTIAPGADGWSVEIIDQTRLPHRFERTVLRTLEQAVHAIASMQVRGAPLIGATAAYGLALAVRRDASDRAIGEACARLLAARPTAVNLRWALESMKAALPAAASGERVAAAYRRAGEICAQDIAINQGIGRHGLRLLQEAAAR